MKFKSLILISSLLLVPFPSEELYSAQPLECITSEVEEETYAEVITPIAYDVAAEDGGSFGNGVLIQEYIEKVYVDIPVRLNISNFYTVIASEVPYYISCCCLKIAC